MAVALITSAEDLFQLIQSSKAAQGTGGLRAAISLLLCVQNNGEDGDGRVSIISSSAAASSVPADCAAEDASSTLALSFVQAQCPIIGTAASRFGIALYVWSVSGSHLAAARETLGIVVTPTVFAVSSGTFLDKLQGSQLGEQNTVETF